MLTITVDQTLRRKKKMTMAASMPPMMAASITSPMASEMNTDWSYSL